MAHYALLNSDNVVEEVITGVDETNDLPEGVSSWEEAYTKVTGKTAKRTSYNTYNNAHNLGGTPFRGNYAGPGYTYDTENDVFIPPQPFASWTLDTSIWNWVAPVAKPSDGKYYYWVDSTQEWVQLGYSE
tara:strand:- start:170 stop:559 length:390 start_codon:yes stop_codon:yes gene_type:complete